MDTQFSGCKAYENSYDDFGCETYIEINYLTRHKEYETGVRRPDLWSLLQEFEIEYTSNTAV